MIPQFAESHLAFPSGEGGTRSVTDEESIVRELFEQTSEQASNRPVTPKDQIRRYVGMDVRIR